MNWNRTIENGNRPSAFVAAVAGLALAAVFPIGAAAEEKWYPYPVEVWDPPFDMASPRQTVDYVPLDKASQPWDICVSFPHMKDAYWLALPCTHISCWTIPAPLWRSSTIR